MMMFTANSPVMIVCIVTNNFITSEKQLVSHVERQHLQATLFKLLSF